MKIRRVLLPTDLSETADRALNYLLHGSVTERVIGRAKVSVLAVK